MKLSKYTLRHRTRQPALITLHFLYTLIEESGLPERLREGKKGISEEGEGALTLEIL